ncbi:MAG: DUF4435 domain-containing protein [Deltaproteobacteria bacterium]|nr:DUF4435 domain-containing protein [Deltaproteobacteria bacterium]
MILAPFAKNPGAVVTEIRMVRLDRDDVAFLVVEGRDDGKFWRTRVSKDTCDIVVADGKPNVVGAIKKLDAYSFSGAIGFVDDDFDRLLTLPPISHNLVSTDAHDLECMLIRSRALDKVLAEHGSEAKISAFEKAEGSSVREALLTRGLVFGRLRYLATKCDWPLDFAKLPVQRFTDDKTWAVDESMLLEAACDLDGPSSPDEIRSQGHALSEISPYELCQGHDLVALLVLGLRNVLGDLKPQQGIAQVSALLRHTIEQAEFQDTDAAQVVFHWESAHAPYRIFAL